MLHLHLTYGPCKQLMFKITILITTADSIQILQFRHPLAIIASTNTNKKARDLPVSVNYIFFDIKFPGSMIIDILATRLLKNPPRKNYPKTNQESTQKI